MCWKSDAYRVFFLFFLNSKEASTRLRKNNPDLTDLSDKDRPTKLADKYTELYDNEWTDAFEELQNTCRLPEEQAVSLLLSILMVKLNSCITAFGSQVVLTNFSWGPKAIYFRYMAVLGVWSCLSAPNYLGHQGKLGLVVVGQCSRSGFLIDRLSMSSFDPIDIN